jgi:hypothetical protein
MRSCPACTAPITRTYFNTLSERPEKIRRIGQINEIIRDLEWVWLYEGRNIGWWIFDIEFQELLEESYDGGAGSVDISTGGVKITVNFHDMIQKNTHNSAVRKILRIQRGLLGTSRLTIKGIAGMK